MNKSTRTFIWGLILFFIGFLLAADSWMDIQKTIDPSWRQYLGFCLMIFIMIIGSNKIDKTTY